MLALIFNIVGIVLCGVAGFFIGFNQDFVMAAIFFVAGMLVIASGTLINSIPRKNVKKRRTSYTAEYKCNQERVQFAIELFMKDNGYLPLQYNDEQVYKKGNGWWMARKFIKCTINEDNTVLIEGWTSAGVGNAASTEMPLTGFYAAAPKQQVVKDIEQLKFRINVLQD